MRVRWIRIVAKCLTRRERLFLNLFVQVVFPNKSVVWVSQLFRVNLASPQEVSN